MWFIQDPVVRPGAQPESAKRLPQKMPPPAAEHRQRRTEDPAQPQGHPCVAILRVETVCTEAIFTTVAGRGWFGRGTMPEGGAVVTDDDKKRDQLCINTIRTLSMDVIQALAGGRR